MDQPTTGDGSHRSVNATNRCLIQVDRFRQLWRCAVAEILGTSRQLFVHGYYVYEFVTVVVAWSLLAVETALRARLPAGESATFKAMLKRAESEKVLTPEMADRLDAGRQIRNSFSHPTG